MGKAQGSVIYRIYFCRISVIFLEMSQDARQLIEMARSAHHVTRNKFRCLLGTSKVTQIARQDTTEI